MLNKLHTVVVLTSCCLAFTANAQISSKPESAAATESVAGQGSYFDFSRGSYGWNILFANYPAGQSGLETGYGPVPYTPTSSLKPCSVPPPSGCTHFRPVSLYFKATGASIQSPDLTAFGFREIRALKPNSLYALYNVRVLLASNASRQSVGAGGPASLQVRVGGSVFKPEIDRSNNHSLNIDVLRSGMLAGDTAIDQPANATQFRNKTLAPAAITTFKTDAQGRAWIWFAGLHNSNAGLEFYIRSISFHIEPDGMVPTGGGTLLMPF